MLTALYDQELREDGIQTTQFALLSLLVKHPGGGQQELAAWLAMEQSTLSRNLQGLARKGWVSSLIVPGTRVAQYQATPAGRRVLRRARPAWTRAQARVKRSLGADWDTLWPLLRKLSAMA